MVNQSPILTAIQKAEECTEGEIHVHLTQRWWEPDPLTRAKQLFSKFQSHSNQSRNFLIYVNFRRRKFALIGGGDIQKKIGNPGFENLAQQLIESLRATQRERAVSQVVDSMGLILRKYFPWPNE
jgi:uncharacterized membrane protein